LNPLLRGQRAVPYQGGDRKNRSKRIREAYQLVKRFTRARFIFADPNKLATQ
jgi:hypothetical protein